MFLATPNSVGATLAVAPHAGDLYAGDRKGRPYGVGVVYILNPLVKTEKRGASGIFNEYL